MSDDWLPPLEGWTQREKDAIESLLSLGGFDGGHHKQYALDQALRILTGCPQVERTGKGAGGSTYQYMALGESDEYLAVIAAYEDGEDGPHTYEWDTGIAP